MYCTVFVLTKWPCFFTFSKGTACKKLDALRASANYNPTDGQWWISVRIKEKIIGHVAVHNWKYIIAGVFSRGGGSGSSLDHSPRDFLPVENSYKVSCAPTTPAFHICQNRWAVLRIRNHINLVLSDPDPYREYESGFGSEFEPSRKAFLPCLRRYVFGVKSWIRIQWNQCGSITLSVDNILVVVWQDRFYGSSLLCTVCVVLCTQIRIYSKDNLLDSFRDNTQQFTGTGVPDQMFVAYIFIVAW